MYWWMSVIGFIASLWVPTWVGAQANPTDFDVPLQQAAMHQQTRGDVSSYAETVNAYRIDGTIDATSRTWSAQQSLFYRNTSTDTINEIPLRLFANLPDLGGRTELRNVRIDGEAAAFSLQNADYIAMITLPRPLAPGERVTLSCDFVTQIPWNVGRTLYGAFNHDGQSMALASAYPMVAEYGPNGWEIDIPDTKGDLVNSPMAFYDVTLTVPQPYRLASTGTAIETKRLAYATRYRVVSGLQRDFMAVISQLGMVSDEVDGTLLHVYFPVGKYTDGQRALKYAQQSLQLYNRIFGQYPYNELDIVAVDASSFYGVEYPGLILMQDRLFDTAWQLESIIVHEVAHQWFYNVVGNDVQLHPWVDESMASYAQILYREQVWGKPAAMVERNTFVRQYAKLVERRVDGPIDRPMWEFNLYTYNVIAYAKGALYIDALRTRVGDEAFARGLQSYYQDNRYQRVTGDALRESMAQACACDLQSLYQTWVLQP